ncbi:MAG: hypothetical protein QXS42_06970 [Zestosphaera sp.]
MGGDILLIFSRVAGRSSGVKVSAVTALNILLLLTFRSSVAVQYAVLSLSVIASVAAVVVDFRIHASVLYVLFIHGLRPGQVKALLSLYSLLVAGLISTPYIMAGPIIALSALTLTFTATLATLNLTYRSVRAAT